MRAEYSLSCVSKQSKLGSHMSGRNASWFVHGKQHGNMYKKAKRSLMKNFTSGNNLKYSQNVHKNAQDKKYRHERWKLLKNLIRKDLVKK